MGNPKAPVVSVIIPVYRGEKFIERTLDSLAAQTFADFEILCVDDHSPDGSGEIIRGRAASDSRVRYLRTPSNQGIVPKVINSVRHEVNGRYFAYSSQDDFFSPDWLEKMVARMDRGDVDAVVPNVEMITSSGSISRKLSGWDRFGARAISGKDAFLLSVDWTVPGNALWKTEFLERFGFFDFALFADDYTSRFYFLQCDRVGFCDGTFYYEIGNPQAITARVSAGRLDFPYTQYRVWELIHDHAPNAVEAPATARSVVRHLLEALVMIEAHPELSSERSRLSRTIEAVRSADFRADLRRTFLPSQTMRKAAAFALLDSALVRTIAPKAVYLSRRLRRKS